ncbi:hypothetical protein [Polyangium sp. 15x6]|uniref:hypothetical protein n=1 Tax=Polyangium sp. 15x6 TaxID=3042687 RepID=UPI00249C8AEF|nr:hypothetical protein [Polyangium sp. 15x6]
MELVFEVETPAQAAHLVLGMLQGAEQHRSLEVDGRARCDVEEIPELLAENPAVLFILPSPIEIGELGWVPDVGIRVVRVPAGFDVELSIDLDDIADPGALARALFSHAQRLAAAHEVTSFYAGLEPASDEDTRLFTGSELGPYRFPSHE